MAKHFYIVIPSHGSMTRKSKKHRTIALRVVVSEIHGRTTISCEYDQSDSPSSDMIARLCYALDQIKADLLAVERRTE